MLLGTALGKRDALLDFLHFPLITRNIYNAAEIIVKDIMEQEKLHNIHDCAPSSTKLLVAPLQVHMLFQSRAAAIWNRTSVGLCTACELEVARPGVWLMRGAILPTHVTSSFLSSVFKRHLKTDSFLQEATPTTAPE